MESRQNLLTHISREQGLDSQNFQCRDCSAPIGMSEYIIRVGNFLHIISLACDVAVFGHAKVCTFNARLVAHYPTLINNGRLGNPQFICRYYCKDCHKDEEVLIPARIIHNWDFNKHKGEMKLVFF